MGMFNNKEQEQEKAKEELQKYINKYKLYGLSQNELEIVSRISRSLSGNTLAKIFGFNKIEEQVKASYLSVLVDQNWIIINKLTELNNKIGKI